MKKRIASLLLMLMLLSCISMSAYASDIEMGQTNWSVTFNSKGEMVSNFSSANISDAFNDLEPGDARRIRIRIYNDYNGNTDWYMLNEVVESLETAQKNSNTRGGGYTYQLAYMRGANADESILDTITTSTTTVKLFYDSDLVGGDENPRANLEGMKEATNNLKDYFYMDTLSRGGTGKVILTVRLDGETQGNDYQDTAAKLKMRFAVEVPQSNSRTVVVRTGDEYDLTPFYIAMVISGLVFLYLALDAYTDKLYGRKD